MTDYDALSAEFYDASARGTGWSAALRLPTAVTIRFRPSVGPLIDLGAGSGLSTLALADACTTAEIIAVEPSQAMRAVLMARVLDRWELRDRITVLPGDITHPELPEVWGGLTARGLMGHIDDDQRRLLWRLLAARLAPCAVALVDEVPQERPVSGRRHRIYDSSQIQGRREYETVIDLDTTGPARNVVTHTVRDRATGRVLASLQHDHRLYPISRGGLAEELAWRGLVATPVEGGCLMVQRAEDAAR